MHRPNSKALPIVLLLASLLCTAALADGILLPPPDTDQPQIFSVKYHHVDVKIDGQAAVTSIDQVFHNDSSREAEGIYLFPVPEGAVISRFSMYAGDKQIEAKILDKDEARRIYESIVRRRKDPALLEYVGRNMFRANVYPIPANGDKRIRIEYSEVLSKEAKLVKYVYPMSTERFSARPLENVRVTINLTSTMPISNVYSPTYEINLKRQSPTSVQVEWQGSNLKPDRDLVLYYQLSDEEFPIQVLTHREPGEPGYFMLLASPSEKPSTKPQQKDVVFVIDRTGSMSGEKIEQAKSALKYCLNALGPNDRFNVIAFNEDTNWLKDELVTATKANIKDAVRMVDEIEARGGTNIDKAMRVALSQRPGSDGGRRGYVVFLTDGLPTVGETSPETILQNARSANKTGARIFVFGVGNDVNAQMLDKLAQDSKADADYVLPKEDIEVKVTSFFDKVSDPIFTDVELNVRTILGMSYIETPRTSDVCPVNPLPDIFRGGQLIVIGRYSGAGEVICSLSGTSRGRKTSYEQRVMLAKSDAANDFIPRLWAARRIGYLLDEIRLHKSDELVKEVVRLSREFGIPTEFTSFFADDRDIPMTLGAATERAEEALSRAAKADTGSWSVSQSSNARDLRNQSVIPGAKQRDTYVGNAGAAPAAAGGFNTYDGSGLGSANTYRDEEGRVVSVNTIQNVGSRTFYQRSNRWVDARYNAQRVYRIKQFSDAHFRLIAADPELKRFSTLGEVTVVVNGNAVEIASDGQEMLTDREVKEILGR